MRGRAKHSTHKFLVAVVLRIADSKISKYCEEFQKITGYFSSMMETRYYQIKAEILALAEEFLVGDEFTKERLRSKADFFPISKTDGDDGRFRALMIRKSGELFLVEDTRGGELGVFALLQPSM